MKPLKLGIVGVGGMGRGHVRKLSAVDFVELVAVADVVKETAHQVGAEYGLKAYTSHEQLLEESGAEAVLIAVPHPFHAKIACDAAARGVHVLTEKPIAVAVSEAEAMIEAARKGGVLLGVMFQQRLRPVHRKMKEIIDSGLLGEVWEFEMISTGWYRVQSYYDSGSWRGTWKGEGGGIIANQAPHNLDLWQWLCGMPRSLTATLKTRVHRIEVENTVQAMMEYDGPKTGYFKSTTADPLGKNRIEVQGEKGRLVLEGGTLKLARYTPSIPEHILSAKDRRDPFDVAWEEVEVTGTDPGHAGVVEQFARAIRFGEPLVATGEDGLNALALANAMHLSGFEKRPVTFPLNSGEVDALFEELRAGRRKVS